MPVNGTPTVGAMHAILVTNAAATWFMAGLIWFVQGVHYPMFADVGVEAFAAYHARHTTRTGWVVIGPMVVELLTTVALVWYQPAVWTWAGLSLVALIWLSTAVVQVPHHNRLSSGFDGSAVRRLSRANWVRTIAWSLRASLMAWALG